MTPNRSYQAFNKNMPERDITVKIYHWIQWLFWLYHLFIPHTLSVMMVKKDFLVIALKSLFLHFKIMWPTSWSHNDLFCYLYYANPCCIQKLKQSQEQCQDFTTVFQRPAAWKSRGRRQQSRNWHDIWFAIFKHLRQYVSLVETHQLTI